MQEYLDVLREEVKGKYQDIQRLVDALCNANGIWNDDRRKTAAQTIENISRQVQEINSRILRFEKNARSIERNARNINPDLLSNVAVCRGEMSAAFGGFAARSSGDLIG